MLLAQSKASFHWGNFKKINKYSHALLLFEQSSGYGSVVKYSKGEKTGIILNVYDSNLKFTASKSLVFANNKEKLMHVRFYNQRVYILTHANLPNMQFALRIREINIDSLDKPLNFNSPILFTETRFSRGVQFHIDFNDTLLGIWCVNPVDVENVPKSVTYITFNPRMQQINKAIIELPISDHLCEILKIEEIDQSNFIVSTKEYAIRPIEKRGFSPNYWFNFYLVKPNSNSIKSIIFNNKKLFPSKGKIRYQNGLLEATGFFASQPNETKQGIWYLKYDFKTSIILIDTLYYFDKKTKSLPNNGFNSRILKSSKLESLFIDYFISLEDDVEILVAEQFFLIPASLGSSYTYNRLYGDILILYITKNGEIDHAQRLIKTQNTYNNFGEFSSYYLERKDSVLHLMFNEHYKNENSEKQKHLVHHKHSNLIMTRVTKTSVHRLTLTTYKGADGIIQARDLTKIANDKYLVYARKKKQAKFGIMTLN